MALSNAERQARLRERKQQRLNACITAADIDRAVQMLYEACRVDDPSLPAFDEWLADVEKRTAGRARHQWQELLPHSSDPDDYHDHLSDDDRRFLAKVGAVIKAANWPAKHR
jgi:hypothetical protein